MRRSRNRSPRIALPLFLLALHSGCAGIPLGFPTTHQALRAQPAGRSPAVGQFQEMRARALGLDASNQQLHAALAQQQQQTLALQQALQQSQQEAAQLRAQLDGAKGAQMAAGATARSASHQARPVNAVRIPNAETVQDGDVVRIRIDSGQLFSPGRADLKPEVSTTLDRIAQALMRDYAGHLVGIEGHTDSDPIRKSRWKSNHELSVARATAVFQALKSRGVPEARLFVAGHGPNEPLSGNDSRDSKSRNRRVEIVVYPELAR
jgi:chemotaxis protein MotB